MLTPFQVLSAAALSAGTYARTDREALAWAQLERGERLLAAGREHVVARLLEQGHSWVAVAEILGESRTTLLRQYRGVQLVDRAEPGELDAGGDLQLDDVDDDQADDDAGTHAGLVEVPEQRSPEHSAEAEWLRHLDQTNACAGCGTVRPDRSAGQARWAWWRQHRGCAVPAAAG